MQEKNITVTFMSGPYDGRPMNFPQPEMGSDLILNIGRREHCEISLHFDNQVSRLHAQVGIVSIPVTASESVSLPYVLNFWLQDMGSRNGTFLENEKISIKGRVSLRPGTLFRIGRTWLRLEPPLEFDME